MKKQCTKRQLECLKLGRSARHGFSRKGQRHKFYKVWCGMKERCQRPKHTEYKRYGARGIKVCNKWQKFDGFLEDKQNSYSRKDKDVRQ